MQLTSGENLTADHWDHMRSRVLRQIGATGALPDSIIEILSRDLGTLRAADANGDGASVVCELTPVTDDYLDFLRRQVALNARGESWTSVLSNRLTRLAPYTGRSLLRVTVRSPQGSLTARFRPMDYELVHWEVD